VQQTVVEDRHPADALVQLSVDADLLVVGSRGRGGLLRAAAWVGEPCRCAARSLPRGCGPLIS
jgi:nucleotide-binding universal stress UspA family protein